MFEKVNENEHSSIRIILLEVRVLNYCIYIIKLLSNKLPRYSKLKYQTFHYFFYFTVYHRAFQQRLRL